MCVIQYFKVDKDISTEFSGILKMPKKCPLALWEGDLHAITHLAIWNLYFNLSCPLEEFQEDVRNSSDAELGGKQTKTGNVGRI